MSLSLWVQGVSAGEFPGKSVRQMFTGWSNTYFARDNDEMGLPQTPKFEAVYRHVARNN